MTPSSAHAVLTNVNDANDICAPSADPCVLTQSAEIQSGAVLDFGTRTLVVQSNGVLTVGSGSATIRCGGLTLSTTGTAVALSAPNGTGGSDGGILILEARRRCSGNGSVTCLDNTQCASIAAGTCTIGSGAVSLGGKIIGNADSPGALLAAAAGPISVSSVIQLNGTSMDADGGMVSLDSADAVTVSAIISLNAGAQAAGGDLSITAKTDVTASAELDVSGGDFDGGTVDLTAGRDVVVTNDINASALTGAGYGGEIDMTAGRDLTVAGGTSSNRVVVSADGHESVDLFGGDGGTHDYSAGRNASFGEFTRFTGDGSPPDGFGDYFSLSAKGDVSIDGDVYLRALGAQGGGGDIEVNAAGNIGVSALSEMGVTGGSSGAGTVTLSPGGNLTFAGVIDGAVSNGGAPGAVGFDSSADIYLSGSVTLTGSGFFRGGVDTTACRVNVLAGTDIANKSSDGLNTFTARERITIESGAVVSADQSGGTNKITYRTSAKPPVIAGQVTPSPVLVLDRLLPGCPVCGNSEIDGGETCDDGNAVGGDGCSADCQDEGCVADTPGYPTTPLCSDGDPCTLDPCDTQTHSCTHVYSCDDGIDCTEDSCGGDACVHTPIDTLCDSGTPCADGFCNAVTGCVYTAQPGPCDDGRFCNGADTCSNGACIVHAGDPCTGQPECLDICDETNDQCESPAGTPCTSDGRPCTADVCDAGFCTHPDQDVACDDGIFCNGPDFCSAGECDVHQGDPCTGGGECRDVCNETTKACWTDAGVACTSDGNFCTEDACSGYGYCSHNPYARFQSFATHVVRKDGADNDRFGLKSTARVSDITVAPTVSGLRLEIVDLTGASLFSSELPGGSFVDVKGDGSLYRFRDKDGLITSANGVFTAVVKRNVSRGLVSVVMKARTREMPELANSRTISPALSWGSVPGSGPCLGAIYVSCNTRGASTSCHN